ncbi:MAG: ribose-5-phosphate isomerase RpiA [Candidatus Hadarchaeota archaeon]
MKRSAGRAAAKMVEDGMNVGLGSGSTLAEAVKALGEFRPEAKYVVSSVSTQRLAESMDLELTSLESGMELDLVIDGADEINPDFDMIKGGGGALTREKMVASAGRKVAIVVDESKLVKKLGEGFHLPVEVVPFAYGYTSGNLERHGKKAVLRKLKSGVPFVTDNGNYILDLKIDEIEDPESMEVRMNSIPGVIENGIFHDLADLVFLGHKEGCDLLRSKEDILDFY